MTAVPIALELAVQSGWGASIASRIGATSMEVAPGLAFGGLTASPSLARLCLAAANQGPRVNFLIRPRQGGFVYSEMEKATMLLDVEWFNNTVTDLDIAAGGIVIGALTESGNIDTGFMREAVEKAGNLPVTFHRAIDQSNDLIKSARELEELGVERILTSGGASVAGDGVQMLVDMQRAVPDLEIAAGGGLSLEAIPRIIEAGIRSIHVSAKTWIPGESTGISLGAQDDSGDNGYFETGVKEMDQVLRTLEPICVRRVV